MRPEKAAKGQKNFEAQKLHSQVVGRGQIMGDG